MRGLIHYFFTTSKNIFNKFLLDFWSCKHISNSGSLSELSRNISFFTKFQNKTKNFFLLFLSFFKNFLFYITYLFFYFSFSNHASPLNYLNVKSFNNHIFGNPYNFTISNNLSGSNFFINFLFLSKDKETFEKAILRFFLFSSFNNKKIFHKNIIFYYIFNLFNSSNLILQYDYFFLVLQDIRLKFRVKQLNNKHLYSSNNHFNNKFMLNSFLIGLKYFWLGVRLWLLPLYVFFVCFFCMLLNKMTPTYKFFFIIFVLSSFFYWLLSGFTFFVKKYQYRYFTSAIQRFWKRSFALFWMLEFFLFFCFFYLTLMSSQEPFFMFDNSQIFKTHLFSWRYFLLKVFPTTIVIVLTYFLIISLKWGNFSKMSFLVKIITFILFYIVWVEFYQFYTILSYYGNLVWKFEEDDNYWFLENEFKRTRIQNHFLTICLIAKFWHVVFAAYFWLFFIYRGLELNRFRFPLLSSNLQNFVFVYVLSWLYMFPWAKYVFLKLFNAPYYWFYVNNKRLFFFIFFNDLGFFVNDLKYNIFSFLKSFTNLYKYLFNSIYNFNFNKDFFYYHSSCSDTSFLQFKKNFIKDKFFANI